MGGGLVVPARIMNEYLLGDVVTGVMAYATDVK